MSLLGFLSASNSTKSEVVLPDNLDEDNIDLYKELIAYQHDLNNAITPKIKKVATVLGLSATTIVVWLQLERMEILPPILTSALSLLTKGSLLLNNLSEFLVRKAIDLGGLDPRNQFKKDDGSFDWLEFLWQSVAKEEQLEEGL